MKQFNRILSIFEIAVGAIFIAISVFYFCIGLGCYFSLDSFCRIEGSYYVMWGLLLGAPLVVCGLFLKKLVGGK